MTHTSRSTRALLTIACVACAAALPGCIIQDIRDDLRGANERLDQVDSRLQEVEVTNTKLAQLETQLELLQSIDASLKNLDVHLASLRKTIGNIDSAIPFLKISGDEPEDESQTETGADGDDATGATRPDTAPEPTGSTPE